MWLVLFWVLYCPLVTVQLDDCFLNSLCVTYLSCYKKWLLLHEHRTGLTKIILHMATLWLYVLLCDFVDMNLSERQCKVVWGEIFHLYKKFQCLLVVFSGCCKKFSPVISLMVINFIIYLCVAFRFLTLHDIWLLCQSMQLRCLSWKSRVWEWKNVLLVSRNLTYLKSWWKMWDLKKIIHRYFNVLTINRCLTV